MDSAAVEIERLAMGTPEQQPLLDVSWPGPQNASLASVARLLRRALPHPGPAVGPGVGARQLVAPRNLEAVQGSVQCLSLLFVC